MSNQKPTESAPLHFEVAVSLLGAAVVLVLGLLVTIWTEDWAYTLTACVLACGTVFVAACIPQIRTARQAARDGVDTPKELP
jgi:hypothetical protein